MPYSSPLIEVRPEVVFYVSSPYLRNPGFWWRLRLFCSILLPFLTSGILYRERGRGERENWTMSALQYLETLRNSHPELSDWYNTLADLYQKKLWHQLTLKLEQFVALAVFQVTHLPLFRCVECSYALSFSC